MLFIYEAIAHNSIAEGCRLSAAASKPFPHSDMKALEGILKTQSHRFEKCLIIVEGAYSMDGDIAPVPELVELKKRYGCFLMVDEAHTKRTPRACWARPAAVSMSISTSNPTISTSRWVH